MDFKSYVAASRAGSDNRTPFRGSALVNSRKPNAELSVRLGTGAKKLRKVEDDLA